MATKRMLIDASHPEETRVAVVIGNRLDDFDVEVASKRQLKGNIYLAKVTRVEPSLQAAFVEYGGNRHGFLAFSEIHPDYYQIPVADRQALLAEEEDAQRRAGEALDAEAARSKEAAGETGDGTEGVVVVGGDDDEFEEAEERVRRPSIDRRRYKIQEVIKRRQILLVQVVKEERGNKGAALTTYLSLAGRYCVLMPNTARGGGISRKIAGGQDRKRLKSILSELGIPDGMAMIVRTAGAKRTKAEIKRDYEYLIRLWEQVRQKTLESIAPALIHEEGNLIKRSIRDLYTKDIEEVIVAGDEGYRNAKDYMKLLIPSHAKRVQPYKDATTPLMQRFQIESQIDSMHLPQVQLRSGGYIVINATEALVAIDVNSGRATRERNIEETALKTNIEAAEEIARQLRLRDLAGLIVIDFIDMENHRNQHKVERALKEAMRSDRARIQIGRISPFGLLEMSRQRLRPSLQEIHNEPCPHCSGTGIRRSTDTTALQILRNIEEEAMRRRNTEITVHVPTGVALYILNQKRAVLKTIEDTYELVVFVEADDTLIPPDFRMDRVRSQPKSGEEPEGAATPAPAVEDEEEKSEGSRRRRRRRGRRRGRDEETPREPREAAEVGAEDEDEDLTVEADDSAEEDEADEPRDAQPVGDDGEPAKRSRRRRRGRRAGRRRRKNGENDVAANDAGEPGVDAVSDEAMDDEGEPEAVDDVGEAENAGAEADVAEEESRDEEAARPRRGRRRRAASRGTGDTDAEAEAVAEDVAPEPDTAEADYPHEPSTALTAPAPAALIAVPEPAVESAPVVTAVAEPEPEAAPKADTAKTTVIDVGAIPAEEKSSKKGWWRRG